MTNQSNGNTAFQAVPTAWGISVRRSFAASGVLVIAAQSVPAHAHDEHIYFTAQGGMGSARSTDIRDVGGSYQSGTTGTDLGLKNPNFYGAKFGIYSRTGVLGLEGEVFRARPDVKPQTQTYYEPTFGPSPAPRAGSQEVTTLAMNLLVRLPLTERFVVHAGAGPAIFRSELRMDNEQAQSSRQVGLNTQLGVSYFITKQVAISAEWKHNAARFKYPTHGTTEGFTTNFRSNYVGVGISYAFEWEGPRSPFSVRGALGMPPAKIGPEN